MTQNKYSCPLQREQVIDKYFLEHRAKLIDIAAFLDRIDRAEPSSEKTDFRITAMQNAFAILTDNKPDRAKRILESLSDTSTTPIDKATEKAAAGAPEFPETAGDQK